MPCVGHLGRCPDALQVLSCEDGIHVSDVHILRYFMSQLYLEIHVWGTA